MMKRFAPAAILGVLIAWVALAFVCCTTAVKNPHFEERLIKFMNEAEPGSTFKLFNGTNLSGWEAHGLGRWTIEDGVLTLRGGLGYLATRYDRFDDFILTLQARVSEGGNSGVHYRARHPGFSLRPWPVGFEAQIDPADPDNPTGSLYDRQQAVLEPPPANQWFSMRIECIGERHQIFINGERVVEAQDASFESGFIALQGHHPSCTVEFRDIVVRIPAAP